MKRRGSVSVLGERLKFYPLLKLGNIVGEDRVAGLIDWAALEDRPRNLWVITNLDEMGHLPGRRARVE